MPMTMTVTTIDTDLITPLGAYLRLREPGRGELPARVGRAGRLGRYSLVGCGSRLVSFDEAEALGEPVVGYLGYDPAATLEPTVPLPDAGPGLPESRFVVADALVRFDHARGVAEVSTATRTSSAACSPGRRRSSRAGAGERGALRRFPTAPTTSAGSACEGAHPPRRRVPDRPLAARRRPTSARARSSSTARCAA